MLEALISHNDDLQRLQRKKFVMELCEGWLVIHHIPYLTENSEVKEGTLLMELSLSGVNTIKPKDHTAYWIGEWPYDTTGKRLPSLICGNQQNIRKVCGNYTSNYYLSCHAEKEQYPPNGEYPDYYEKVSTYFDSIASSALLKDKDAWIKINYPIKTQLDNSSLVYTDTNASRANITPLNIKFKNLKIAIIGLGGTGGYILDTLAKTPVKEIHLFDADEFNTHNAFRAPGAPTYDVLNQAPKKVDYFKSIYSNMHSGIVAHTVNIDQQNLALLDSMDYVFLSLDKVRPKKFIAQYLLSKNIPFIDSGMGLDLDINGKLEGLLHVAIGTQKCYKHLNESFGDESADDDAYASDVQIAELNSLAADLSVISWKKMLGFYADRSNEYMSVYDPTDNEIINKSDNDES